jgi:hypothetical protein
LIFAQKKVEKEVVAVTVAVAKEIIWAVACVRYYKRRGYCFRY